MGATTMVIDARLRRPAGRLLLGSGTLALLGAGATVAAAAALAHASAAAIVDGATLRELRPTIALLVAAVIVRAATQWGQEALAARASASTVAELGGDLFARVVRLGPGWLASQRSKELATLAGTTLEPLDGYFTRYLPRLAAALVVPPVIVGAILVTDPWSGLVVLLALPLSLLVAVPVLRGRHADATERLAGRFLDVVAGLTTLRVYRQVGAGEEKIVAATEADRRGRLATLRVTLLSTLALELAASASVAVVAVQAGSRLAAEAVSLRTALLVLLLAAEPYLPLRRLGASFRAARQATEALDLLARVPAAAAPPRPVRAVAMHGLEVREVTVRFPELDVPALPPTSFALRPGELVAVVAASGAGKSTLLSVLLGFTPPTSGTVLVGGENLADVDPVAWRTQVAWAPQHPTLLTGTIADNVRLGNPRADDAAVRRALALAGAAGLNPRRRLRDDAALSPGERQQIALARAFLRAVHGAGLVLLDEPTAHLDAATEAEVLRGVRELTRSRCVLMVVHRPALAGAADRTVHIGAAAEPRPSPAPKPDNRRTARTRPTAGQRGQVSP